MESGNLDKCPSNLKIYFAETTNYRSYPTSEAMRTHSWKLQMQFIGLRDFGLASEYVWFIRIIYCYSDLPLLFNLDAQCLEFRLVDKYGYPCKRQCLLPIINLLTNVSLASSSIAGLL